MAKQLRIDLTEDQAKIIDQLDDPAICVPGAGQEDIFAYVVEDTLVTLYVIRPDSTYHREVLENGGWTLYKDDPDGV